MVNRDKLASSILAVIADGGPYTAREITALLRSRHGLAEVTRHEVNSVLYRDLSTRAHHDSGHRWSLMKPDAPARAPIVETVQVDAIEPSDSVRASLLRTIQRLRCGLPPLERIADLTAGGERAVAAATDLLAAANGRARWMLVTGDYGQGKSHSLALLRELAHSYGHATAHLSCDGWSCALNQPQRFLAVLLATMEVPGQVTPGYENLLHVVLRDLKSAKVLKAILNRQLTGTATAEGEAQQLLSELIAVQNSGAADPDEVSDRLRRLVSHLTGQTIRHRSAAAGIRALSYRLLRVAIDLLQALGVKGLVILVDEVESVYTKLSNVRSRRGAHRVLAALCESGDLHGCRVAVATTPDAFRRFLEDVPMMVADDEALQSEPVAAWSRRLTHGDVVSLECRPLNRSDRYDLLARVRRVYSETYGCEEHHGADGWRQFETGTAALDIPTRLVVRQAIDFLDASRYART